MPVQQPQTELEEHAPLERASVLPSDLHQTQMERPPVRPLLRNHGGSRCNEIRFIPIDQFLAQEAAG
jgi:hypothetical protein